MYVTTDRVLKFGYFETKYHEMTNQLYLGLWASNKKNKTTLFSETLKVEENKVVLFFYWRPTDQDINDLSFHDILSQNNQISTPYQW